MKLPLLAPLVLAITSMAQGDEEALKKASTLFPSFSESIHTNETKAKKIYDELVALGPEVQQRLLSWLDKEFAKHKAAYSAAKDGGRLDLGHFDKDADEIAALQKQLKEIRSIKDHEEMKQVLKKSGWPTLTKLLREERKTIKWLKEANIPEPNPAKALAAQKKAQQIGKYRHQLRKKLQLPALEVEAELNSVGDGSANRKPPKTIEAYRKAIKVLAMNKALIGEIPRDEYDGILELNEWRIALGMQPLLIDPKLCEAARDHCKDMAKLGFFAHNSPVEGKATPADRAKNFGTTARGENIAINNSTKAANMAWFFSPGHHVNMFKPNYSVIGLGIQGRHYCQMFR